MFLKRVLEILSALAALIALLPALIVFSIILMFELREFPFFTQKRGLSLETKLFRIFKFKTIKKREITDASSGVFLKPEGKCRITKFAGFLRQTGMDELPQLINIILGNMTFVGPRPLMITDLEILKERYPEHHKLRTRLISKPGITGIWQIFGDREKGVDNLLGLDIIYEKYRSIYFDVKLALSTLPIIFFAKNSDAILYNKDNFISRYILPFYFSSGKEKERDAFISSSVNAKLSDINDSSENISVEIPLNWWTKIDTTIKREKKNEPIILRFPESDDEKKTNVN